MLKCRIRDVNYASRPSLIFLLCRWGRKGERVWDRRLTWRSSLVTDSMRAYPSSHGTQSPGIRWCLAKWLACENVLWHFSQVNGFSPVCVRMWLFKVVAPEKVREQNPHLNSFSLVCMSTWPLKSDGVGNESLHCPHWYGFSGVCEHSCIWSSTRCVNVFKHCWHLHMPNSSGEIPNVRVCVGS